MKKLVLVMDYANNSDTHISAVKTILNLLCCDVVVEENEFDTTISCKYSEDDRKIAIALEDMHDCDYINVTGCSGI